MIGDCVDLLVVAATVWLVGEIIFAVPLALYSLVASLPACGDAGAVGRLAGRPGHVPARGTDTGLALVAGIGWVLVIVVGRAVNQLNNLADAVDEAPPDVQRLLVSPPLSLPEERVAVVRRNIVTGHTVAPWREILSVAQSHPCSRQRRSPMPALALPTTSGMHQERSRGQNTVSESNWRAACPSTHSQVPPLTAALHGARVGALNPKPWAGYGPSEASVRPPTACELHHSRSTRRTGRTFA